jgi:hypothetical protein
VTITTHAVCVAVDVSQLSLKGGATVTEQLAISYNGAEYAEPATPVDTAALHEYCGAVPDGATNVFWQLLTTSGGDKPTSQALVTQTLSSVTL